MTRSGPRHGRGALPERTERPERQSSRPAPWAEADDGGEARSLDESYVPRHLASREEALPASPRRFVSGAAFPYAVLATAVVLVLSTVAVLAVGAGGGGDPDDGDTIAAVSDAEAEGGGAAEGGEVPTVQRPARPAGAPVQVEVAPSPPVRVEVPRVGITSLLENLSMGQDGVLTAPMDYGTAGWFAGGPQPGQPGPSVIAGHVDSRDGPAVFFRLGELQPGDEVLVHREDGSTVRFEVDEIEQYPKDAFPSTSVYGPVPGPELRLITCAGAFDRASHSYRDNLVVYATAVGTS